MVLHWGYRNILAGVHLFYTIYFCANLIISSDAVDEEGGIALCLHSACGCCNHPQTKGDKAMHPMQLKVECKEMDNHALQLVEVEICNCDKRQTRSVTEPTLELCATLAPKCFGAK